jgi:mono/diheme cytochrome c family protein
MFYLCMTSSLPSRTNQFFLLPVALVAVATLVAAQRKDSRAASEVPSGAELYARHCAVCHGSDLKGTEPVPAPYRTPPDLTTLSRRHAGKFPMAYVSNVLKKGATLPAHAPAEMPVWGSEFEVTTGADQAQITARIRNLALYIKSYQEN